jgi:hypothetical protein
VLRPHRPILPAIRRLLETALPELHSRPLQGKLWIVVWRQGRPLVYWFAANK